MKKETKNSKLTQSDTVVAQFDMKTFADRLREVMIRDGVTQQQLAEKLGSKRQTISQYVNGTIQPNIGKLFEIADIFNVSADWLIGLSNSRTSNIDDRKMQELLGLSERTIKILKEETELSTKYKDITTYSAPYVVNLLVEEGKRKDDRRTINILWDIFTHKREADEHFGIVKYQCSENDTKEVPVYNEPYPLTDDEVFAVRLLQLQKALILYKDDIDNNVPRVPNFGEDDEE